MNAVNFGKNSLESRNWQMFYNRIYIGNLAPSVSSERLFQECSKFGEVRGVKLYPADRNGGRGYAFVSFVTEEAARTALQLNRRCLDGVPIRVNYMRTRVAQEQGLSVVA